MKFSGKIRKISDRIQENIFWAFENFSLIFHFAAFKSIKKTDSNHSKLANSLILLLLSGIKNDKSNILI